MKGSIQNFRDLIVWQKSIELFECVYMHTKNMTEWRLQDQIRKAALSVSSNIAEGHDRNSSKNYVRFLDIAKGSNNEVRSQSYALYKVDLLNYEQVQEIEHLATQISKMLSSLIRKIEQRTYP